VRPYTALPRIYDEWMAHLDYDRWADYLWSLMNERDIGSGARIVDMACGTGLIAVRLARRGCRVTGVDRSPDMLTQAAAKSVRGEPVRWVLMDMRGLRVHRPVDCVVCACDGINYLTTLSDAAACFGRVAAALRPGGWFLFDISSRDKLSSMDGQFYGEETDTAACLWQNRYDLSNRVLTMDMTFFIDRGDGLYERAREVHRQRAHDPAELADVLTGAGFDPPEVFTAFTRRPPEPGADRLQFVARKRLP
jgi:SAM-dependent methyltransferase